MSNSASAVSSSSLIAIPGLLATAGLAALGALVAKTVPGLANYQMILCILFGVLAHNALPARPEIWAGVAFTLRYVLRLAIVLLGLQITAQQMAEVGALGVAGILLALMATLAVSWTLGRLLGVAPGLALLIGMGSAICGASAIVAAKASVRAEDDDAAYAIACVTLFGTMAMLVYPLAQGLLHLPAQAYGFWIGASVHEVAQVLATAFGEGDETLRAATIAKLTRVAALAPVIIALGASGFAGARAGGDAARPPFPWFLSGFLAMVAVATWLAAPHDGAGLLDAAAAMARAQLPAVKLIDAFLLSMAMAAMGLHTNVRRLLATGFRPLLLGLLTSIFISGLTLAFVAA